MKTINTISELRSNLKTIRTQGKTIALIPTMGNLHEGHLQLIDIGRKQADIVVCSIFVNPTQFGENEDFNAYPRTMAADSHLLESRKCDMLFAPPVEQIYPPSSAKKAGTEVTVPELSNLLCGAFRPGHFTGVATIVSKLFNMTQADVAIFGEKDFQQLAVIRRMVDDLNFPIKIIGAPIARDKNGLALSSRNNYLSDEEKERATFIYRLLQQTKNQIDAGQRDFIKLQETAAQALQDNGFRPDYFEIRNSITLLVPEPATKTLVILCAAFLNKTRLIDNLAFTIDFIQ